MNAALRASVAALGLVLANGALGQHAGHGAEDGPAQPAARRPPPRVPPVTAADRAAAFPAKVTGHAAHDRAIRSYALVEKLEWRDGRAGGTPVWDLTGWVGQDVERLWFRSDGTFADSAVDEADVEAFWGRAFGRWWDLLVGVRQDFEPGRSRTWGALGVQGLAPRWFEIQLTGYVSDSGRFAAVLQSDYDLLLTNRLILQPRLDLTAHAHDDRDHGVGSGLSSAAFGMRLRYEIRREFAPYIGLEWERALGDSADYARAARERVEDLRLVAGLRMWF
jgi:copper resistance protein B